MKDNEILITVLNKVLHDEQKRTNQDILPSKVNDDRDCREVNEQYQKRTTEELIRHIVSQEVSRPHLKAKNIIQND